MSLKQILELVNKDIPRVVITTESKIPELNISSGQFVSLNKKDIQGEVLYRDVISISVINNMIMIEI